MTFKESNRFAIWITKKIGKPKQTSKVAKCFERGSALFWPEKRQNVPQIFFSKNATISVKGATIWEFFGWKWLTIPIFYVIIFSKYPKYNISQRFFNIFNWKISFWRLFLILLGAPNYFWRHKEFQKRHSGAKAPLLATLNGFRIILVCCVLYTIATQHQHDQHTYSAIILYLLSYIHIT